MRYLWPGEKGCFLQIRVMGVFLDQNLNSSLKIVLELNFLSEVKNDNFLTSGAPMRYTEMWKIIKYLSPGYKRLMGHLILYPSCEFFKTCIAVCFFTKFHYYKIQLQHKMERHYALIFTNLVLEVVRGSILSL